MPHPLYHLGPCGFISVVFYRWINFSVFVLANILIDVEVLADNFFSPGWPVHQLWHWHTFIVGSIVGAAFGTCVYLLKPARLAVRSINHIFALPGHCSLLKSAISGMLGTCTHVLIDACYHFDVQAFWPYKKNLIWYWFAKRKYGIISNYVETACLVFWVLAIIAYAWYLYRRFGKNTKRKRTK